MRIRTLPARIAVVGASLFVFAARAHHSFAPHFDASKPISISGTITEFEARNPHSYLHVAAVDENGKTHEYVCESHGVTQLTRNGITPEMLKAGTQVRVQGSLSRSSEYMCFFDHVELADGRVLDVNGPTGAQARAVAALPPRKDIFGTWLLAPIADRSTSGLQPMMQSLTPAGHKAVDAYDPFKDDPTFRCDPVAIRRVWGAPGTPLEIVKQGSDIVLHHEWMDVHRVVHMDMKEHPKDGTRTSLGHSIGHFDGDTLVIETANYSAGVLNQYVEQAGQPTKGLLHSAALTSVERLHVDAARQRLVVEIDLSDPEFFTRPFDRARYEYAASDLAIQPFNCSPEGVSGSLHR
jgi:hypothetical protein